MRRLLKPLWIVTLVAALCPWPGVVRHLSAQDRPLLPPELLSLRNVRVFYLARDLDAAVRPVPEPAGQATDSLPARPRVVPTETHIRGRIRNGTAELDCIIDVTAGTGGGICILGMKEAVLQQIAATDGDGASVLWEEQAGYVLDLPRPGRYRFSLNAVVPVVDLKNGGVIRIALPGSPVTNVQLLLPEDTEFIDVAPDRPRQIASVEGGKQLTIAAGAVREVLIRWSPLPPRTPRVARFVVSQSRVWADDRAVTLQTELRLAAAEPVATWDIHLPPAARVVSAEPMGEARFDRSLITEKGRTTLRLLAVDSPFSHAELRLELQFPFAQDGSVRIQGATVADAAEHTGWLVFLLDQGSQLGVTSTEHLTPRDPADYPGELPGEGPVYVWRVGGEPFVLQLRRFAVAGPIRASADIAAVAESASTSVAVRFVVRAEQPLEAVRLVLPKGTSSLRLVAQDEVHAVPPVEVDASGRYPEQVTVRSPGQSNRLEFTVSYRLADAPERPSAPRTVPLPALIGAELDRVRVIVAATDAPAWLVSPRARETQADFDAAAHLLSLLAGDTRLIVRAYELPGNQLAPLEIQRGSARLSYHGEATVALSVAEGRLRVRQTLSYAPATALLRGLELMVPPALERLVRWPDGLRVQPLGEQRYLIQTAVHDAPGSSVSISWQFDLPLDDDGPVEVPLVTPDNLPVAWTELSAELPATLRLTPDSDGWREAGLSAQNDAGTIRWQWYRAGNVPGQVVLKIERLAPTLGHEWFLDRALYSVVLEPPDTLRWHCHWHFGRLRTRELTIVVPAGAALVEVWLDGQPAAWGPVARNRYRVQVADARGSSELKLVLVQQLTQPLGLFRTLTLTPPSPAGSGVLGETLWELKLPPLFHPVLGSANYAPLYEFSLGPTPGWFRPSLSPAQIRSWLEGKPVDELTAEAPPAPGPRVLLYSPSHGGPLRMALFAVAVLALVAALAWFVVVTVVLVLPRQLGHALLATALAALVLFGWWDLSTAVLFTQYGLIGALVAGAAALVRRRLELERVRRELFRPSVAPGSSVTRDSRSMAEAASEVR